MTTKPDFLKLLDDRILVLDGAMGTNLHRYDPTDADWGGKDLVNCTEWMLYTHPEWIRDIHRKFLEVGSDGVETNTFGANRIALNEFGKAEHVDDINRKAVALAREVCNEFSTPDKPRYVIGSIGPGTKSITLGHISFDELVDGYRGQVKALIEGGTDVLLVETAFDLLNLKAVCIVCVEEMQKAGVKLPLMAQVTIERQGTMLTGTDMGGAMVALEALPIDIIGLNCATGPDLMVSHIRHLSDYGRRKISCLPNAGLPENVDGKAHFPLTAPELARALKQFVGDFGVNIVGGCCGTTYEHIRQIAEAVKGMKPRVRNFTFEPSASSLYQAQTLKQTPGPLIVGERTNTTGSRKFKKLLEADDIEGMAAMAREQQDEGAHLLDVCVAYPGRDEVADMNKVLRRFNEAVRLPMVIDSTEWQVMAEGLKYITGKPFLNSINLEEGRNKLDIVVPLAKKYGAALVALTIDETGQATTCDWKFDVAKRIYDICVNEYGIEPTDLYFDPLTLPVSTGQSDLYNAGVETLNSMKRIKNELPGAGTWLGLSNISFGLDPYVRQVVNSVFLKLALDVGLDAAILNASKILPLNEIDPEGRKLAERLLLNQREEGDPLQQLISHYENFGGEKKTNTRKTVDLGSTIEERLKNAIIMGRRDTLVEDLETARQTYSPLDIINTVLLDGMKVVGDLFGSGQMQLPFVLQSAEVMKASVKHLEQYMTKAEGSEKGKIVLATVKGDVHDIGKNLVDIILTNNGYKVYNIGIKQSIETILDEVEKTQAQAIGMSGLLVKSTVVMKENLELMQQRGLKIPVICGGAALTRRYVEDNLRRTYQNGTVFYGEDAFSGLHLMEELCGHKPATLTANAEPIVTLAPLSPQGRGAGGEGNSPVVVPAVRTLPPAPNLPKPPFLGTKVVQNIDIAEVFRFINERTLIGTQWQFRKNNVKPAEYERQMQETAYPLFDRMKKQCIRENILRPTAVYGYFPAAGEGNDLIIFEDDYKTEKERFHFPRQIGRENLCLADYFAPRENSKAVDHAGFFVVTVGKYASERARQLFEQNNYTDYMYLHGISVEAAEATAEYWHKRMRNDWGIGQDDDPDITKLFKLHYRGCRYSFGYPACPNLEDQVKLCKLLQPERIGITLSEEFQLEPEQSTSALVVHHPDATYFNVK
jgi:5-methyltetrahydrofolate--homocysteine methyltransferase